MIEKAMSEELMTYFSSVDTLRHSGRIIKLIIITISLNVIGGHFVPATGEDKKVFVNYLVKMQSELL